MDFEEWIKPSQGIHPFVTREDKDRSGEIIDAKLVNTQYGIKLFVDIAFNDNKEVKTLSLSKSFAVRYVESLGKKLENWKGTKVKINTIAVNVPRKGIVERPLFEIIQKPQPTQTTQTSQATQPQSPTVDEIAA